MYQELSKKQQPSLIEILCMTLVIFSGLFIFNYLGNQVKGISDYTDLLTIFLLAIIIYFILRKYLISYKYMLIEEEFIIQQKLGSKEKILLNIHTDQIKKIESNESKDYNIDKSREYQSKQKLFNTWIKGKSYYCIYEEDNKSYFFEIQPSEKMLQMLKQRVMN